MRGICLERILYWAWAVFFVSAATAQEPRNTPPAAPQTVGIEQTAPIGLAPAKTSLAAGPANGPIILPASAKEVLPPLSDAERITRLERSLEADAKRLEELKTKLNDPESEYAKAEAAFKELDLQIEKKRQELVRLKTKGSPDDQARVQAETIELEKKWKLAKDRFQLAIEERKTQQANVVPLEQKIQKDRAALDKLRGVKAEPPPDAATPAAPVAPALPNAAPANAPTVQPRSNPTAESSNSTTSTSASASPAVAPVGVQNANAAPAVGSPAAAAIASPAVAAEAATPEPPSKELLDAEEKAVQTEAAAAAAEEESQSITQRIELLQKNIEAERRLRDLARKKVDNAEESVRTLNNELQQKLEAGENVGDVRRQVNEAVARLQQTRAESRRAATQLDELQTELGKLQAEQLAAMEVAEAKRNEADEARRAVEALHNPFAARNMLQWILNHGFNVVVILLALCTFLWVARVGEARLVRIITLRGGHGGLEERENRAKTLVGVFHSVAKVVAIAAGAVMVLDEIGVPVGPLLGGAAVVGLAIAFGAQSLIKDYFTGFMILSEQQYMLNDVIKIGDTAGQVERVTLRMTVLRDLEGKVHFIPHGQINTVTNMTHGWSRAVFDIGVAYKEDVDRVIETLLQLARELRCDPLFGRLILEDATMLGLDALGDSAVMIKFFIKTRPLQQWTVKRELLRRIKNRFDELGIEIPFPHRTVYHRDAADESRAAVTPEPRWRDEDAA